LVVPTSITTDLVAFSGTANALSPLTCTSNSGTIVFKPGLSVSGPAVVQHLNAHGKVNGCTGGRQTSGKEVVKFTTSPTNCSTFFAPSGTQTGTLAITWNVGGTSTGNVTGTQSPANVDEDIISGTLTSGPKAGTSISMVLNFTPITGNCTTTTLTKARFKLVGLATF
jgi:hypothetical protein